MKMDLDLEELSPALPEGNVREWYLWNFQRDSMGMFIDARITFRDVMENLQLGAALYDFIGARDSAVRQNIFRGLTIAYDCTYEEVYSAWAKQRKLDVKPREKNPFQEAREELMLRNAPQLEEMQWDAARSVWEPKR